MSTLSLRTRLEELPRLEEWVRGTAERFGLLEPDRLAVNLVLEELFANVVRHGSDGSDSNVVRIRLFSVNHDLHIEVEDDGREFDPADAPAPDLDLPLLQRPIGGLGIHLVRSFVDELVHRRRDGWNLLSLVKKGVVNNGGDPAR